jgi:hypothetical protein
VPETPGKPFTPPKATRTPTSQTPDPAFIRDEMRHGQADLGRHKPNDQRDGFHSVSPSVGSGIDGDQLVASA